MEKRSKTLIKVLVVIICFLCTDGSRSLVLVSNNLQVILSLCHANDIEIPHQHNIIIFNEDEKSPESCRFDFSNSDIILVQHLSDVSSSSQEYSESIWQPPKFV